MKQIKIIQELYLSAAEEIVNDFCKNHNVLEIKNCDIHIEEVRKEDDEIGYTELFNIMIIYEVD